MLIFRYQSLLKEKKNQFHNQAQKLRGGLSTLNATQEQVAHMQNICQDKAIIIAKAKEECEEVLVEIVSEKRIVDEQELKVRIANKDYIMNETNYFYLFQNIFP